MSKFRLLLAVILSVSSVAAQDTVNVFLQAYYQLEKGDTTAFKKISKEKNASSNYAYYLCLAQLAPANTPKSKVFELYRRAKDLASTSREKAIVAMATGNYFESNDLLIQALDYYQKAELMFPFTEKDPEYVALNKNIGMIQSYIGSKEKAVERFTRIFDVAKKTGNKKMMAASANNIAISAVELKRYAEAEKYLGISLNLRIEANDKFLMGQSYNNFGTLYFEKGDYEKAVQFFNKGYLLRKNFGEKWSSVTESEINLAKTYLKLGKPQEAERLLQQAYAVAREKGHVKFKALTTFYLKDIYLAKDDYKKAYEMQEEYHAAQDSLYGLEKKEQVNRLSIESEFKGKIVSDSLALLKKESELRVKESRNSRNMVLLGCLGLVLILVLLLVINLSKQKKVEQEKNRVISSQANELREQHKEIKDSINYARNLQQSLLPSNTVIESFPNEYFILYLPKDVVSGDFYWASFSDQGNGSQVFHFALADCTGHGVPGAMVSIVGITALNRCINEFKINSPAAILDKLSLLVAEAFSHNDKQLNDGMDISLCSIEKKNNKLNLKWSGANNPLWIIRDNKLIELKATRRPVGAFIHQLAFKEEEVELQKNDMIYMVTDGYGDQFGGDKGKKFKQSKLKDLLAGLHTLPVNDQKKQLAITFDKWKSRLEQIDDVSVIGFRI